MPRILDDLNEDPEFQALSPAAKTAVMQAAKRKPLVTMDAADPAPPKRTRSVVEREPAPDPLDAYLPKKPPVPKAVSARFKRAKEQDSVDQLAEDTRNRRIGMTGPALTAERLRENLAGAALQGAKDMGNPVQLGAEVLGAALARPALDAIAEDDERKRPAIERAADRSPAARRIQPNYYPKDAVEHVADFLKPIEDAGRQIAADPADAFDPTRPGTAEGQAAFIGATGVNLVDPIGDAAVGLALKGAGKLVKGAANLADPRSRIASRIADAARAAERTGADLGDVGRVDPATQSGVLIDDGTPQKSWPERLDNLGQQMARRARGGVMKRGVTADNAESVMAERARMMDEANRMQGTARSMMGNPAQLADMRPLPRDGYRPVGEDPPPPAAAPPSTMVDQPPTPAPNPAGGSSLDDLEAAYQRATQAANRALETLPAGHPDLARLSDAERVARDAFNRAKAGRFAAQAAPAPAAAPAPRGAEPWQMPRAEFEATGEDLMHGTSSRFDRFDRQSANRYGAKGRNEAGRFYFTDKPEVADTFAGATGYKQVDVNHFAEAEGLDAKEAMPGLLASLREQIAKGRRLVMPDPDTGSMIDVTPDDPRLAEYLLDEGDVRLYAPNRGPNVIKAKVYGKTLDLTDRAKLPPDLVAELKAEGRYDPTARMPDFQHEYSKVLYDWARRNGYGKIRVGDTYESGFKSTIGLEEFIGYGRDPHREAVEQALREGKPVPAEVLADYPNLTPGQAAQPDPMDGLVQRYEEPGVTPDLNKPQGFYTTPAKYISPHQDLGGERVLYRTRAKNPLDVSEEAGQRVEHARFGRFGGGQPSAGIAALRKLTAPEEFAALMRMRKPEAIAEAQRQFPQVDWSRYHDAYEIMEAVGAQKARGMGYDAIVANDAKMPEFSEFVALDPNALESIAPTQEAEGGGPFLRRLASEERGEFDINKLVPQPKRQAKEPWQMTTKEFLGDARLTKAANGADLRPKFDKSTEGKLPEPFMGGRYQIVRGVSERWPRGAYLVLDNGKPIAQYDAYTLSVDKAYRRQGIATALIAAYRTENPGLKLSEVRTPNAQKAQKAAHKMIVEAAIRDGRPVPADVLAGYPDLASIGGLVPQPKRAGTSAGMSDPKDQPAIDADLSRMFSEQAPSDGIERMARDAAAGNRDAMRALEAERTRLAYEMDMPAPGSPELGAAMRAYSKFEREVFDPAQESFWNVPNDKKTTYGADPVAEMGGAGSQTAAARTRETEGLLTVARWDRDNIEERIDGFWAEQREQDGYEGITRDRDGTLAELRRNREFRDLEAQQQEIAAYMRSLEADLAGPAGPSTPEPAGAFDLPPDTGPSFGGLVRGEDGAFRPGAIGDTLRRLFGRDKAPIPAPQAAIAPRVSEATPMRAGEGLTFDGRPVSRATVPLDEINLDPQTYQFKASDAVTGRNARFDGEDTWRADNLTQKPIMVHRRADGRLYVADGHQRVNLARSLRAQGQVIPPLNAIIMDEADGWTPDLVMRKASLMNLDEGTGNALDVARLIAKGGMTPEQVAGLAKSSAAVRDGRTLSTLDDEALTFVANQDIKPSVAAAAAQATDDPAMRMVILREIADDRPATAGEAALLARDVIETGISQGRPADQLAMFDLSQYSKSNRKTLYKIVNTLKTALKGDESLGRLLTARADEIKRVEGNALNDEANNLLKTEAGALQYMLEREAGAVGPFRDALKALAAEVDRGQITVSGAAARARQALADAGPQELRQPDGAVRVGGVEERPDPRPVQAQGPLPDTDLFGNPVGAPEPAAVAPATAEPFTPPAPTPEAGGPVVAPERSALERMAAALERTQQQRAAAVQARNGAAVLALDRRITLLQEQIAAQAPAPTGRLSEVDQLALEQATRMRDRFARAGNERGVTEFQAQIDAIEARRQAAPAEAPTGPDQAAPAPTARQTQGRINNLRMRQRKALDAGNQEEAGRLGGEIQLIEDATNPQAEQAMRVDPNSVAASRYQNFRKFGGSDSESRVFAEMIRDVVARMGFDPKATVTFDDIRSEAAALDPALLDKISRKGLQPGETLHPAVRQAMRDRVKGISGEIADLEERINRGLSSQNVAEAGELEAMAAQLRRDAQSYIDILIPARSQDGRNLAFHRMTAASSFAPEYWVSKARRIVNGNTARPLPQAVEQQMTSTLARGERAQTELERVVERLKARGIDTSFVDNPTIRIPPAVEDDGVVSKFFNQVRRLFKKEDGHWDQAAFDRWVAGAVQALKPQARKGAITFPGRVPGGRPRARYEGPPMTGDAEIDKDLRHAWDLTQEVHGTRIAVAQQLTDLEKTTYLEAIALFRKAGLLTGVKTIQRNIFGTWAAVGLEEVVRWPASAIDALLSAAKLTEEAGQRTTFRPRAAEIAASLSAAKTRGWQEFKEVMAHGMTAEDLAKIDHHREMNTGIKPLDTYVNTVMRFQSAQDRLGKAYAYSRSIQDQARALSKGDEAVRRELMAKPTDDMAREAVADAEFATFTNDTLLGQKLVQLTRGNKPGDAWSFIMDNIIPFKKTPAAVATRVIDYTPMGTVFRLGQVLGERLDSGLKVPVFTENGVERQVVRESRLTAKLNRREQQIVSGALARGGVGTALIAMGALLAANARMNGNYDPRRREEDEAAGRQPGTMRVFGHWVPVGALSPIGNLLALGASLYESPSALGMLSGALGTVLDQPMTQGAQQIVKLTNPSEQGLARDASRLIASQAASYLPTIGAEFAQALDTREDGYARVPEIDTTSTMAAIGDSMRARVPFLRSGLPGKVDSLGNPVRVPGGVSAFGAFAGRPAAEVNDAVIQAVIGLGVELRPVNDSIIDYGVKGRADDVSVKLTPQMEADYRTMRGAAIRDAIGKAIESDEFRAAAASGMQDRMRDVVQAAVGAGQKAATKAFRAQHADGIKAGRPEAMEKKNETLRQRARPTAGDAPWWDEPGATVPPALRGRTATPTSP